MAWYNVLSVSGWLKAGSPTPVTTTDRLPVDTGLTQPTTPADTQPVSGTITANQGASPYAVTQSGTWTVAVNNFPATQAVSGTIELGATTLTALESVSVQNTVTVQSTDLDIRNLSSAQDSVNVGNFPATQAVSGTVTANLGTLNGASTSAKQLPDNHNVTVSNFPSSPSSGTNSSVAGSTSQVTLLAANASRKGATIYNDSTLNALKISLGATVTGTSFTAVIASTGYYEVPFGYTGIITGVFNTATGAARITELT